MSQAMVQAYLMVSDLDESLRFYRDAIGLAVEERGERSVQFDTGACKLKIELDFDPDTLADYGLSVPGEDRGNGAILVLEVSDVEAVYERSVEMGENALSPPRDVPWGRRMFLIEDPDGYVLEVSRPLD